MSLVLILLATAASPTVRPCPYGSHAIVMKGGGECPKCGPDSPRSACRCSPTTTRISCQLGEGQTTKGNPTEVKRPELPEGVITVGDAPFRKRKLTRLARGVRGNFGFRRDGRLYHSKSNVPYPRYPKLPEEPRPDTVAMAEEAGVPFEQIGTKRMGEHVVAWIKKAIPADPSGRLMPLEKSPASRAFVKAIPGGNRYAYISKHGEMIIADVDAGTARRVSPEAQDKEGALSFFAVNKKGVAYLYGRSNSYAEVHWADAATGEDVVLTAIMYAGTVVPYLRPGRPRIVLHAQIGGVQTVVEIDVKKREVSVPIPAMTFWGNSDLSPDGRQLVFGVLTKNEQPRENDLYLVNLGR